MNRTAAAVENLTAILVGLHTGTVTDAKLIVASRSLAIQFPDDDYREALVDEAERRAAIAIDALIEAA